MMGKLALSRRAAVPRAFAAILLAACAAPGPQPYVWSPPPVGATWTLAQHNTGSYGKDAQFDVTLGETSWKDGPAIRMRQSTGISLVATPQSHLHAVLAPDGKPLVTWEPPVGFVYPLQVGNTFKTRHRMTSHARGGMVTDMEFSCSVPAYEKVTVPAGTFDAFRIACTSAGTVETYWLAPAAGLTVKAAFVRPEGSPFGAGTQQAELVRLPR